MSEFNLQHCTKCENVIFVEPTNEDIIFTCPICGSFEDLPKEITVEGVFKIESPLVMLELSDDAEDSKIELELGDSEVDDALKVLARNGWRLKFIKKKD